MKNINKYKNNNINFVSILKTSFFSSLALLIFTFGLILIFASIFVKFDKSEQFFEIFIFFIYSITSFLLGLVSSFFNKQKIFLTSFISSVIYSFIIFVIAISVDGNAKMNVFLLNMLDIFVFSFLGSIVYVLLSSKKTQKKRQFGKKI